MAGIGAYTREALDCVLGGGAESCGEDSNHAELAGRCLNLRAKESESLTAVIRCRSWGPWGVA